MAISSIFKSGSMRHKFSCTGPIGWIRSLRHTDWWSQFVHGKINNFRHWRINLLNFLTNRRCAETFIINENISSDIHATPVISLLNSRYRIGPKICLCTTLCKVTTIAGLRQFGKSIVSLSCEIVQCAFREFRKRFQGDAGQSQMVIYF